MSDLATLYIKVDSKGVVTADKNIEKLTGKSRKAEKATDSLTKAHQRLNSAMKMMVAAGAAATVYSFQKIIRESIKTASALQEVQGKFDVVFRGQQKQAEAWSKTLVDSYTMSARESKQYLSSVQDLLVPMGMASDKAGKMSYEVVKLAADLGSFNDLPTEQVMLNIQSALTGEYESMKKYGVIINADVVQQKALNMGLADTKNGLTAGMKAQAAYALMVESSTAAIGDKKRTQESAANQEKQTTALLEGISALLGTAIIPYYQKALKEVNKWLKVHKDMIEQNFPEFIGKMGDAIIFVIKTIRFFHNGWLGIKLVGAVAIQAIAIALDELFGGLRILLTPLDLVFKGLVKIGAIDANPFDGIEKALGTFRASSSDVTKDVLNDIDETNASYDKTIETIDGWSKELRENAKTQNNVSKETAEAKAAEQIKDAEQLKISQAAEILANEIRIQEAKDLAEAQYDIWLDYGDRYKILLIGELAFERQQYIKGLDVYLMVEQAKTKATDEEMGKRRKLMLAAYDKQNAPDAPDAPDAPGELGIETYMSGLDAYLEYTADVASQVENAVVRTFKNMEEAIVEFVMTGKASFSDLAKSIISDMMRIVVQQQITAPLAGFINLGLSGLLPGGVGASTFTTSAIGPGSADGNIFSQRGLVPFASGGVVNSPTLFPFANGTGLMGEAGPEAIMPLTRIDGELGVKSTGSGANVTISQSFDLRGADESVLPKLSQWGNQIKKETLSAIKQSMSRGGDLYQLSRG